MRVPLIVVVEAMNNLWYAPELLAGLLSVGFLFHRCSLNFSSVLLPMLCRVAVMDGNDFD